MKTLHSSNTALGPSGRLPLSNFAALLAGLALGAWPTMPLQAEVISSFDTPSWTWEEDPSEVVTFQVADGQLKINAPFRQPTDPAAARNTYAGVGWQMDLPLTAGKTLELRVDLVSASQDDVFTFLSWASNWQPGEGYILLADKNELGLMKYHQGSFNFSFPFWESMPTIEAPVTLALRLTRTGDRGLSLLITTTVMERGSGAVLYHRSYLDTPAPDPVVPTPGPHGILSRVPEAGRAYFGEGLGPWVGIWHLTDGQQPPAELILDNFEYGYYDAPVLDIEKSVLLSWPQNTAEEQIVVGATAVDGPWVPWVEPCFKRQGEVCMVVPTTSAQQFFQLAPGSQFIDDFSGDKEPWVPLFITGDANKTTFTHTDGVLRLRGQTGAPDTRGFLMPPGPDLVYADVAMSLDILDWDPNAPNQEISFAARGTMDRQNPGAAVGYLAYVNLKDAGAGGRTRLALYSNPPNTNLREKALDLDPQKAYRLVFSAVSTRLTLELFELDALRRPVALTGSVAVTDNRHSQGAVGLWWFHVGQNAWDISVDNFIVTGTKP